MSEPCITAYHGTVFQCVLCFWCPLQQERQARNRKNLFTVVEQLQWFVYLPLDPILWFRPTLCIGRYSLYWSVCSLHWSVFPSPVGNFPTPVGIPCIPPMVCIPSILYSLCINCTAVYISSIAPHTFAIFLPLTICLLVTLTKFSVPIFPSPTIYPSITKE